MPDHWLERPFAAYDCESTGVDPATDRIVTASMIRINGGGQPVTESYIVAVDVDIPEAASQIHGWTTERARAEGRPAAEVLDIVAADLALAFTRGQPVVGYNICYDLTILEHELRRHDLPTLHERTDGHIRPVIDSLVIDKAIDRFRKGSRKLTAACEHYGVRLDGAHDAAFDAIAAARLAWVMIRRNDDLAALSLDELHDAQVVWRREQCESLAAYFAKQGKPQTVDGCWPVCFGHADEAVA